MSEGQPIAPRAEVPEDLVDQLCDGEGCTSHWQGDYTGLSAFLDEPLDDGIVVRFVQGLDQRLRTSGSPASSGVLHRRCMHWAIASPYLQVKVFSLRVVS